jgi:hypothetical protein
MPESNLRRVAGVSAAGARSRNPEHSEGAPLASQRPTMFCHRERGRMPESNLRRVAGVSAAGARSRNPEHSEGADWDPTLHHVLSS